MFLSPGGPGHHHQQTLQWHLTQYTCKNRMIHLNNVQQTVKSPLQVENNVHNHLWAFRGRDHHLKREKVKSRPWCQSQS